MSDRTSKIPRAYRLPYASPLWLTPRRIVIAALLWGPFVYLATSFALVRDHQFASALNLVVAVPVAVWVVKAKTSRAAFARSLVGSLLLFLSTLVARLLPHSSIEPLGWTFAVLNGLLGVVAAAGWQTLLLTLTLRYRFHSPALDAVDRTIRTAALWASLPALLATTFIVILRAKGRNPSGWLSTLFAIVVPGVVAGLATVRISGRRNWLRRVYEGSEPKWRVVASKETSTLPLVETSSSTETRRVLVRVEDPQDPYREAMLEIPVASVAES